MKHTTCLSLLLIASLAVALAVLVPPVDAQERPPLTPDQEAALYGIPIVTAVGGSLALISFTDESIGPLLFFAMPLVSAASVCGAGKLVGTPGSCGNAFIGGALGALPGLALVGGAFLGGDSSTLSSDAFWALFLLGAGAYILVPPLTAIHGYRGGARADIAPAILPTPGASAFSPGLSLRLHF